MALVGFFHGDKGTFTGNRSMLYNGTFYEITLVEGHRKGENLLVTRIYEEDGDGNLKVAKIN